MADNLPAGFVLDKQETGLPQGFVLDKPGLGDKINTGINWLGTQFTKGVTGALGAPSDLSRLGTETMRAGISKVLGPGPGHNEPIPQALPGGADLNKAVFQGLGVPEVNAGDNPELTVKMPLLGGREVNVGKFLDVIPQAAAGGALMGGIKAVIPTVTSSLASEGAGQATEGTPYEIPARLLAGVAGQVAGNRLQTPLPANLTPEQARLRDLAEQLMGPGKMSVGQETGRLRGIESAAARFPTSQGVMQRAADRQAIELQGKAFELAGAPAGLTRTDPISMGRAGAAANAEFNAAKNAMGPVDLNASFFNQAAPHVSNYVANNPASGIVPAVEARFNDFINKVAGGQTQLSGPEYQQFRKGLNDTAQATGDPAARRALQGIRESLDDAATASSTPQAAAAFKQAREHWGNLKTIEKAAMRSGAEATAAGNLSPTALSATLKSWQGPSFTQRTGGLNDVARVTQYLADMRPNSGTPTALATQHLLTGGTLLGGGGAGLMAGGPVGAAIGVGAAAAPNLIARALTGAGPISRQVRDYLANQVGAKMSLQDRLAQALIGAGAAR